MRKVSMATRAELVEAIGERYRGAEREERGRILDEFVSVTGYHRKHAMRLLRGKRGGDQARSRAERRTYGEAVRTALVVLWEASDRLCGKRLRPLIPVLLDAMERHGHLDLAPDVRSQLLAMSAATIDRSLRDVKAVSRALRRRGVAATALRRSVPVRTFSDWGDPAPGHVEADLVSHSGPVAKGSFAWTLVMTDIATGWTECAPLLVREQTLLIAVLNELRQRLPFPLLGFDTDNDSVFMNETVRDYCAGSEVVFTRCRPYRKNDQAWVEQKNGSVVRRLVGYRRFEGVAATTVLAELYAASRLFVNFFQPSFKLAEKHRDGARVHKRYHAPATPYHRLLEDLRTPEDARHRLRGLYADLDPVRLLHDIRAAQQRLVELADNMTPEDIVNGGLPIEAFLSGLRTAWKSGEARPTAAEKPTTQRRGRRRPDPLVSVTPQLRGWFQLEPWRTGRELLEKLQAEQPGTYPDGLLRTVQRRLKIWRSEHACSLVFAGSAGTPEGSPEAPVTDDRWERGLLRSAQPEPSLRSPPSQQDMDHVPQAA
jgi:hypothetical protein